ncbi:hypothetical protein RFI_08705 [Reticulomyxa filosa]|uniref:Uncharacterized protein n=1 Tax=Reticulomyxa filosa TaxID=46433 RepID=X6NR11_RETFI|nr:hypothetical protein RFI_08705 [Reticulomyxa filosa]|eukprot:ETO28426.1 hypothetical protein RFI_08705 [Reticulomyxa filosa]
MTVLTVPFLGWITLVAFDTCVNSWCVFLSYGANRKTFDFLCKYCICAGVACLYWVSNVQLVHGKDLKDDNPHKQSDRKRQIQEIVVWSIGNSAFKDEPPSQRQGTIVTDVAYSRDTVNSPVRDFSSVVDAKVESPNVGRDANKDQSSTQQSPIGDPN